MRRKFALAALALLAACGDPGTRPAPPAAADAGYQETLLAALLDAQPGEVITLPEGRFAIDRSLSLAVDGVTIRGAGMDQTILSFKTQAAGAEGLLVTANDVTLEDFAIEDAKGDALKVTKAENVVIRRVRTEWTNGPSQDNGAYGLYPVQTRNLLLEGNVAIGASDAGIYVGQSVNVIVRNNRAEYNVAGIEIENTIGADVYDNVATNNTGGILVFNLPNLPQTGARSRVYRNQVLANNTKNFAAPGTAVASVPAGSGVIVNSNDQVEIFDNDIKDHRTANIIVSSLYSSGLSREGVTESFDAYPEGIFIYANRMGGGGKDPDSLELTALKVAKFGLNGALPDILWDGYVDRAKFQGAALPPALRLCVQNPGAEVLNADGPNGFKNPQLATAAHACALEKLPPIALEGALAGL